MLNICCTVMFSDRLYSQWNPNSNAHSNPNSNPNWNPNSNPNSVNSRPRKTQTRNKAATILRIGSYIWFIQCEQPRGCIYVVSEAEWLVLHVLTSERCCTLQVLTAKDTPTISSGMMVIIVKPFKSFMKQTFVKNLSSSGLSTLFDMQITQPTTSHCIHKI